MAGTEKNAAAESKKGEKARLMIWISGSEAIINHPVSGEVKKTDKTKEAWVYRQRSYKEAAAWANHAEEQFNYVEGICFALKDKVRMLDSFANDARQDRRITFSEKE
jgi:hypothetical protein